MEGQYCLIKASHVTAEPKINSLVLTTVVTVIPKDFNQKWFNTRAPLLQFWTPAPGTSITHDPVENQHPLKQKTNMSIRMR